MNTSPREMPVGIQDFEKLRTEGCVYVDKTQYVYALTRISRPFFLGRPRRFGKSLFISTLKAYFLGKKELFEGLAIAELEKDWIEYPVFYIDLNVETFTSLELLNVALDTNLREIESYWGSDERETTPASRLIGLIRRAYNKTGRKVVVLVDEYDKPLINTMDDSKLNEAIKDSLKGFYGVLKSMDYLLRFVFLTGVTKFAKVSVFSDLNQLIDISLNGQYAEICGISETELLEQFQPELHALSKATKKTYDETLAEVKKRYDGYRFAPEGASMYNPFSILSTFLQNFYAYYWFKTGTTTFLAKTLQNNNFDIKKFENDITIAVKSIDDYRAGETSLVPLLYQSGYLTIKSYDPSLDAFTLGFPNEEVKYGFLNELLPAYIPKWGLDESFSIITFIKAVRTGIVDDFMNLLKAYYASIPYDLEENKDKDEKYYQLICYLLFTNMGQFVGTEVKSSKGRADVVVKTTDSIYVFEFKMDDKASAEDALAQIDDNGYLIPYTADHRRLVKIGVEFSKESKGIKRWLVG